MNKTIKTTWEMWVYDVWGNAEDGYEVNNRFCVNRKLELRLKVERFNPDTEREFYAASISDWKLGDVFGTRAKLDVYGDDIHYYVNRECDGYPIGELHCTSHDGLSPIRLVS